MAEVLFAAFVGLKAISQMNAATAQAKQAAQQGTIDAKQRAKEVSFAAARQTASFLSSGITLEGTPMTVENETFNTGKEDVQNIINGANAKSKNIVSAGRSQAIGTIVSGFSGFSSGGGSAGSMFDTTGSYLPESTDYALNNAGFGTDAYSFLDAKDARG